MTIPTSAAHDTTARPARRRSPRPTPTAERLATLARRADTLAAFLRDRRLPGEAIAAANLAEAIRAVAARGDRDLCPVCKHRHPLATECCTLCGWRTVRP